jgi:hypothetical protein
LSGCFNLIAKHNNTTTATGNTADGIPINSIESNDCHVIIMFSLIAAAQIVIVYSNRQAPTIEIAVIDAPCFSFIFFE